MKFSKSIAVALVMAFASVPAVAAPVEGMQLAWHKDGPHDNNWKRPGPKWKQPKYRDCHRSPDRHFVKGYGNVLHRHVGPNCRVQTMKQFKKRQHNNCIRFGDFWLCT